MSVFRAMLASLGLSKPKSDEQEGAETDIAEPSPFSALTSEHDQQPTIASLPPGRIAEPDSFVFEPGHMPRSTLGLYYPEDGVFLIRHPDANRTGLIAQFGGGHPGLIPLSGDWNGDGIHGIGLYDPQTGLFMLRNTVKGGMPDYQFIFGPAGQDWIPLAGDWDGDGKYTVGLYDPTNGMFYFSNGLDGGDADIVSFFGPPNAGWLPVVGDWDGNGSHTPGFYDPARGHFYLRNDLKGGEADIVFQFGATSSGMLPLTGDWDGMGACSVGLYDPKTGTFYLKSASSGFLDRSFPFGSKTAKSLPLSLIWI